MISVADVLAALEVIAPRRFAFSSDPVGLQVGDPGARVGRAVVALDRSLGAARYAQSVGAQMLVTHHPLIYDPLRSVRPAGHAEQTVWELVRAGIAFASAHTNWDAARGGINDTLADMLGMVDVRPFGSVSPVPMTRVSVFCPTGAVERVVDALEAVSAGIVGSYSRCATIMPASGTFRPEPGSNPTSGSIGEIGVEAGFQVEMVFRTELMDHVKTALRSVHPFEQPGEQYVPLTDEMEMPLGRIGKLAEPVALLDWIKKVDKVLGTRSWVWGSPDRQVHRVAIVGGAADGDWVEAASLGADTYLTGEIRQHIALEGCESGISMIASGHYATENPGAKVLCQRLGEALPLVDWKFYDPSPGEAGRPLDG